MPVTSAHPPLCDRLCRKPMCMHAIMRASTHSVCWTHNEVVVVESSSHAGQQRKNNISEADLHNTYFTISHHKEITEQTQSLIAGRFNRYSKFSSAANKTHISFCMFYYLQYVLHCVCYMHSAGVSTGMYVNRLCTTAVLPSCLRSH